MVLWLLAGYAAAAAVFYSYIVATAQDDPTDRETTQCDSPDWQLGAPLKKDDATRKAA